MIERLTSSRDDLERALEALARVEKAVPDASMRRTAAELTGTGSTAELQAKIDRLALENESLKSRLSELEAGDAAVKREAAQLAVRVDRALDQLDLIEKG